MEELPSGDVRVAFGLLNHVNWIVLSLGAASFPRRGTK